MFEKCVILFAQLYKKGFSKFNQNWKGIRCPIYWGAKGELYSGVQEKRRRPDRNSSIDEEYSVCDTKLYNGLLGEEDKVDIQKIPATRRGILLRGDIDFW